MNNHGLFYFSKMGFCLKKIFTPLVLIIFSFVIYYPTLVYGFVFDDFPTIINYIHARTLDVRGLLFANPRWISRLLNQYTYVNWKTNPFAYRIFNVCLHLMIGFIIFFMLLFLLSRFNKNKFVQNNAYILSFLTAAFFLLHPIQTQTVTYITQMRLEGVVTFFVFTTLFNFLVAIHATNIFFKYFSYVLSLVFAALSTGTKEIAVVLPLLILITDWFLVSQGDWSRFKNRICIHILFFLVVSGLFLWYGTLTVHNIINITVGSLANNRGNILTASAQEKITLFSYVISQFKVILHYLSIFFVPYNICFDYNYKLSQSILNFDVVVPFCLLVSLVLWLVYRWLNNLSDIVTFSFAWFFIAILPRATFFLSTELVCDYKTYLASFGMMFLISYFLVCFTDFVFCNLFKLFQIFPKRFLEIMGVVFTVIILGYATRERNYIWSSELLFWRDAVEKSGKARCYHNYATALCNYGDIQGAVDFFQKAIERDDFYGEPHVNLALIYQNRGEYKKSMEHYRRAMEIGEGHPELFNNLGLLHFMTNAYEKADCCFRKALRLRPCYSRAYHNLGNLYKTQGRLQDAKLYYERALQGDFQNNDMFYSCGITCFELGDYEGALHNLSKIDINFKKSAFYIGGCYFGLKNYAKAADFFEIFYKKNSDNKIVVYNYALVLLNLAKYDEALPLFEQCKEIETLSYTRLHYARCLIEIGQKELARDEIEKLLGNPKSNNDVKKEAVELVKRCRG